MAAVVSFVAEHCSLALLGIGSGTALVSALIDFQPIAGEGTGSARCAARSFSAYNA
jgi:hypothetical protein